MEIQETLVSQNKLRIAEPKTVPEKRWFPRFHWKTWRPIIAYHRVLPYFKAYCVGFRRFDLRTVKGQMPVQSSNSINFRFYSGFHYVSVCTRRSQKWKEPRGERNSIRFAGSALFFNVFISFHSSWIIRNGWKEHKCKKIIEAFDLNNK